MHSNKVKRHNVFIQLMYSITILIVCGIATRQKDMHTPLFVCYAHLLTIIAVIHRACNRCILKRQHASIQWLYSFTILIVYGIATRQWGLRICILLCIVWQVHLHSIIAVIRRGYNRCLL